MKGTTITFEKLFDCLPYQNNLYLVTIKGRYLREAMDVSALEWNSGQFLQISGFNITYNPIDSGNKKNGKIIKVSKIWVGDYELVDDKEYNVRFINFILHNNIFHFPYSIFHKFLFWMNPFLECKSFRFLIKVYTEKLKFGRVCGSIYRH